MSHSRARGSLLPQMEKAGPSACREQSKVSKSGNGLSFCCWNVLLPRQQDSDRESDDSEAGAKGQPLPWRLQPHKQHTEAQGQFPGSSLPLLELLWSLQCFSSLNEPLKQWLVASAIPSIPSSQNLCASISGNVCFGRSRALQISLISPGSLPLSLVHCLFQHSENFWSLYQTSQFIISQVFTLEQLDAPVCETGKHNQASCHVLSVLESLEGLWLFF